MFRDCYIPGTSTSSYMFTERNFLTWGYSFGHRSTTYHLLVSNRWSTSMLNSSCLPVIDESGFSRINEISLSVDSSDDDVLDYLHVSSSGGGTKWNVLRSSSMFPRFALEIASIANYLLPTNQNSEKKDP